MASSNIKLFDENKGNMLTDTEFNISSQRLNGLQTGVASSQLQNKAMYQASLVAYAIAQVMMQNGLNANDTDAVSAFVANLSGTMLQKVYDIATTAEAKAGKATGKWMSPALVKAFFDYMKAATAEAQAGTNNTKWMSPALVKAAVDNTLTDKNYLPKSGGTMTGNLTLNANPTANLDAATKQYVDTAKSDCLLKSGGTMTGNLILNANPSANLGAATKQYVDTQVNNVKSALTPAPGDMSKNGWFKIGDLTRHNDRTYVYKNLFSSLLNVSDKMSELAIVLKNLVVANTTNSSYGGLYAYNNFDLSTSGCAIAMIANKTTVTINRIIKINMLASAYGSESINYFSFGDSYKSFQINGPAYSTNGQDLYVNSSLQNMSIKSGTIELWYK